MTTRPPHDEPERDPWLSEALRHAPDANAAPSPELSEAILRSARRAVQSAAAPRENRLLQWWSWLARPPIAAGFATVMVAVLVGVMWFDQPLDATLPAKVEVPATAPAPEPTPVPAPAPVAETTAPSATVDMAADAARKDSARAAVSREREAKRAAPVPAPKQERASPPTSEAPAKANAPLPAPSPAPVPVPTPFSDQTAPAATAAPAARPAAPARDELAAERRSSAEATGALAKSAPAQPATAAQNAMALRSRGAASAPATLRIDDPEHWSWQRGASASAPRPMTPALQRWIAQLNQAARWEAAAPLAAAFSAGDRDTLTLWRDGAPLATVRLGTDGVRLQWLNGSGTLAAPLDPPVAAALQSALRDATP